MRRFASQAFLFLISLILFYACNNTSHPVTSKISGKIGEVLVISPIDIQRTALRDSIERVLHEEYPYIPQSEPRFSTIYITEKAFSNVLKPFRNIFMIHFQADSVQPSMYLQKDVWASGQCVISFYAPDQRALAEYIGVNKRKLISLLEDFENARIQNANKVLCDHQMMDSIYAQFGVHLILPKGYQLRRAANDFCWYSIETPDISQGIFIYKYKCVGDNSWVVDSIVAHRNAYTREYVPGPTKETYMKVSKVIPPSLDILRKGNDTVAYMRGFWEVEGHPMGGAYISYARLTPTRDSVLVTDGYIYAPRFKKRDYVRALDAILLTQFSER